MGKSPHQIAAILTKLAVLLKDVDHDGQEIGVSGHFQQSMLPIVVPQRLPQCLPLLRQLVAQKFLDLLIVQRLHFDPLQTGQLFAVVQNPASHNEPIATGGPAVDKSSQRCRSLTVSIVRHLIQCIEKKEKLTCLQVCFQIGR